MYITFNYIQEAFTQNNNTQIVKTIGFPSDENWEEFTYDKNNKDLLTQK